MFRQGYQSIEPNADIILMSYEQVVVFEADRQASRRYQDRFKMSKKTFKKAIGAFIEKS
jgi:predicted RNA-binding protein (virulence factor B family)